jgi:hypothetical protein
VANVYVFNLYNEPVTGLSVAGYAAGSVPGYATGTVPAGVPVYTPASLAVPRTKSAESGASFSIGDNSIVVPWDSFRGEATITIPDPAVYPVSLTDPLILYLTRNDAVLMTARGYVVGQFPVALTMVVKTEDRLAKATRELTIDDVEPLLPSLRSWLSSPTITHLTVGTKYVRGHDTGLLCVTVGVERKIRNWELGPNDYPVPPTVALHVQEPDGTVLSADVPTDVVEVGVISTAGYNDRLRPTPGGYQIAVNRGLLAESNGTLGANIVYNGVFRLLGNNHMLADNGNIGATVYQPDWALWGNSLTTVTGFTPVITYPTKTEPHPVFNDCDLAWCDIDIANGASNVSGIGQPTGIRAPVLGEAVRWVGMRTGVVQRTTIASITGQSKIDFGSAGNQWAWFQNVITFASGTVAQGDSGSAVVAMSDMRIVGLIFANNAAKAGFATRIL